MLLYIGLCAKHVNNLLVFSMKMWMLKISVSLKDLKNVLERNSKIRQKKKFNVHKLQLFFFSNSPV